MFDDDDEKETEETEVSSGRKSTRNGKKSSRANNNTELAKQKINRQVASRGDQLREQGHCSFCGNPLTMTNELHAQDLEGVTGDFKAYLCDTCQTMLDAGKTVDLKTATHENEDGSISNVSIADLVTAQQTRKKEKEEEE